MAQFDRPTQGQELSSTATEEQSGRRRQEPAAALAEPDFSSMIMSTVMRERAQALSDRVAAAPDEDRKAESRAARRLYEEAAVLREMTPERVERAWQGLPRDTRHQMVAERREGLADDVAKIERGEGPGREPVAVEGRFVPLVGAALMKERASAINAQPPVPGEDADARRVPTQRLLDAARTLQDDTSVGTTRAWDRLSWHTQDKMVDALRSAWAGDVARVEAGLERMGFHAPFPEPRADAGPQRALAAVPDRGEGAEAKSRDLRNLVAEDRGGNDASVERGAPIAVDAKFLPLIKAELMEERLEDAAERVTRGPVDPYDPDDAHIEDAPRNLGYGAQELRYIRTPDGVRREWEELGPDTRAAMVDQMRAAYAGDVERVARGLKPVGMYASVDDPGDESTQAEWARRVHTVVERVDALDGKVKRGEVEVERAPVAPQVPSGVEAAHGAAHSLEAQTERRAADEADLARQLRGESRDVRNVAEDLGRAPAARHGHVAGEEPRAPNAASRAAAGPQEAAWTGTITEAIRKAQELPGVTAFVSADWERHSRPRIEQADDLVKNIDRVRDLIAPELANMRVYTVTPEGRVHNTVTGRDEYVALSPEVVKARPELERAVEKAHPAPPGRVQELAKAVPSITPDLN